MAEIIDGEFEEVPEGLPALEAPKKPPAMTPEQIRDIVTLYVDARVKQRTFRDLGNAHEYKHPNRNKHHATMAQHTGNAGSLHATYFGHPEVGPAMAKAVEYMNTHLDVKDTEEAMTALRLP